MQSSHRAHHDLLIAEILLREAEAKLGGKEDATAEETSKASSDETEQGDGK